MDGIAPAGQATELATTQARLHNWQAAALVLGATTILASYAYLKLHSQYRGQRRELRKHRAVQNTLKGWLV